MSVCEPFINLITIPMLCRFHKYTTLYRYINLLISSKEFTLKVTVKLVNCICQKDLLVICSPFIDVRTLLALFCLLPFMANIPSTYLSVVPKIPKPLKYCSVGY